MPGGHDQNPARSSLGWGEPHALLDLDYLSWAGTGTGDHAAELELMLMTFAGWL
jgi:hypothetical protein